jgi:hypothetical protein
MKIATAQAPKSIQTGDRRLEQRALDHGNARGWPPGDLWRGDHPDAVDLRSRGAGDELKALPVARNVCSDRAPKLGRPMRV